MAFEIQYLCIIEHGTVKLFNFYFKKDAPNIIIISCPPKIFSCLPEILAVRPKIYIW